ncbi:protein of unassigned function [Methylobacterium oryzae CBMB20]|uniref:Protein of unassigned function n=1 Tax=Methylobacterium oryzae CBMB20 TaxID=693986 RepID=A0A089NZ49_9HYPH|nr:protein of unassigned function [Methylobacterium oryzae CBMB20]
MVISLRAISCSRARSAISRSRLAGLDLLARDVAPVRAHYEASIPPYHPGGHS